jgi:hypothetical protein
VLRAQELILKGTVSGAKSWFCQIRTPGHIVAENEQRLRKACWQIIPARDDSALAHPLGV